MTCKLDDKNCLVKTRMALMNLLKTQVCESKKASSEIFLTHCVLFDQLDIFYFAIYYLEIFNKVI